MRIEPSLGIITGSLPLGGSTTFLCNLAGAFFQAKRDCLIYSFESANPLEDEFARQRVKVHLLDQQKMILEDRLEKTVELLAKQQPSAVLASLSPSSFEVLRYVPAGVTRIGMVHSHDPGVYSVLQTYAPYLDIIVGVSRKIVETLQQLPETRDLLIKYIPYGVAMDKSLPICDSTRTAESPLRIIYIGRLLEEQKRVRLFPEILQHLRESGIPFSWTIAGSGPEEDYLREQMVAQKPTEQIRFLGEIPYQQVGDLFSQNDIFLLASAYEGLPLSLLEAMGQGVVPVVSNLESGIRDVVTDSNGIRVDPKCTGGYAQAIITLHKDRNRLAHMRLAARKQVESLYSTQTMADQWIGMLVESTPQQTAKWPGNISIEKPLNWPPSFRTTKFGKSIRRLKKTLDCFSRSSSFL